MMTFDQDNKGSDAVALRVDTGDTQPADNAEADNLMDYLILAAEDTLRERELGLM